MNSQSAGDFESLMLSYQESLHAMLSSLRQLEGHLNNIQARTFEMTEEISYLVSDNMGLLSSVNDQLSIAFEKEPRAPNTPVAPPAPWDSTEEKETPKE